MEEDRFEVIDQDAYEAVNAKERTRITSFDDASFYYVDGSLTEAVIAGKKRQIRKLAQKQPVRRSPALECAIALSTKGLTEFMIRTIHRNSPSEEVLHWNVQLHFPQRD